MPEGGAPDTRAADLRLALQFAATTLLCLAVPPVTWFLLAPHIHDAVNPCLWARTFLLPTSVVNPEGLERATFLCSILLVPLAGLIGWPLCGRLASYIPARVLRAFWTAIILALSAGVALLIGRFPRGLMFLGFTFPPGARSGAALLLPATAAGLLLLAVLSAKSKWNHGLAWLPFAIGILLGMCFLLVGLRNTRGITGSF